jgi:hypothetical protein
VANRGSTMKQALPEETLRIFDTIAGILLRCFVFIVVAQVFVWLVIFLAEDALYQIYDKIFGLSKKEYDLFILYSLTFMKILNIVFFLMPFLAIKLMLRGRNENT